MHQARGASDDHEVRGSAHGGILVVTEVRREITEDPNFRAYGPSSVTEALDQQPYREEDAVSIFEVRLPLSEELMHLQD